MKIRTEARLSTMFLDHLILCFILIPIFILVDFVLDTNAPSTISESSILSFGLLVFLYYNKDFVNGRSIAKRITGFVVVDRITGKPASSLKCFVRNLTIVIWPLEVIFSLTSPKRRLGDFLAGTKLVKTSKASIWSFFNEAKSIRPDQKIIWIVIIGFLYSICLNITINNLVNLNGL